MTKLTAIASQPISQELLDKIVTAFPYKPVKDDDSLIAIGREAGRKEVVDFVKRHATTRTISGNPDDLIKPSRRGILEYITGVFRGSK